jgi:hypothetical protein
MKRSFQKTRGLLMSLLSLSSAALAYDGHFYLGAGYGKSFGTLSDNNPSITYYQGYLTDAYPLNHSRSSTGIVDLQGGYEFTGFGLRPAIAVGLGVYKTPNSYRYTGQMIETPLGSAGNTLYDYSFRVRSTRIMAETKFTWSLPAHITPFVELGVGPAWTRLMDYQETSISSDTYVALPGFSSHTNNNLAYQAGVGVGYAFNIGQQDDHFQHERLSIGYRFVNLGSVSFGTRGTEYPYTLSLGTLQTQDFYLGFTHFF